MKQLVFSFPDQKIPVVCLYYGDFSEDGFKPITDKFILSGTFCRIFGNVEPLIRYDDYFNNTPFIRQDVFDDVFKEIIDKVDSFSYYPNLLVCTLKSDSYGTEEEDSQA